MKETTVREYFEKYHPTEIEYGFLQGDMSFENAVEAMKNDRTSSIFFKLGCEDTLFRDHVFEGIRKYLKKNEKQFAKWANSVQTEYTFFG